MGKDRDGPVADSLRVLQFSESHESGIAGGVHRFTGLWNNYDGCLRARYPNRSAPGLLNHEKPIMKKTRRARLNSYLLPFGAIGAALLLQFGLSLALPKGNDFPFAFFYLIAVFIVAWYGGY